MAQTSCCPTARRSALLWGALLVALAAPAHPEQDYHASFRSGVQAYERKHYKEAVSALRQAAAVHPQEGGEDIKITGAWSQAYIPHFFLGAALYAQGDCPGALREWKESEHQGFPGYGRDELEVVRARKAACLGPLLEERSRSADAEVDQAERERQSLLQLESSQAFRDALSDPTLLKKERDAVELLGSVRERMRTAKAAQDPDALAQVQDLARQAGATLRAVKEQASDRLRLRPVLPPKQEAVPRPAVVGDGPPPVPVHEPPVLKPPPSQTPPSPLQRPTPPAVPGAGKVDLQGVIDRERARRAADPLREGVRAYFAGRYAETLRVLATARFSEPRTQAEAALFAAASRMAEYWLGGMRDEQLLAAARGDVLRCKQLDGGLTPDLRVFSPRFISFFASPDQVGKPPQPHP